MIPSKWLIRVIDRLAAIAVRASSALLIAQWRGPYYVFVLNIIHSIIEALEEIRWNVLVLHRGDSAESCQQPRNWSVSLHIRVEAFFNSEHWGPTPEWSWVGGVWSLLGHVWGPGSGPSRAGVNTSDSSPIPNLTIQLPGQTKLFAAGTQSDV